LKPSHLRWNPLLSLTRPSRKPLPLFLQPGRRLFSTRPLLGRGEEARQCCDRITGAMLTSFREKIHSKFRRRHPGGPPP